jgi:hypothetical protein
MFDVTGCFIPKLGFDRYTPRFLNTAIGVTFPVVANEQVVRS